MPKTNRLWGDSIWVDVCMLYESISVYSFPFGGNLLILTPVYVVLVHNLLKRTFSSRYLWIAMLSVLGAATIKVKSVPSGDVWIGFGLTQAAGISFAFGQVAYRDWKKETHRWSTNQSLVS